jgi:hypothetical protein
MAVSTISLPRGTRWNSANPLKQGDTVDLSSFITGAKLLVVGFGRYGQYGSAVIPVQAIRDTRVTGCYIISIGLNANPLRITFDGSGVLSINAWDGSDLIPDFVVIY